MANTYLDSNLIAPHAVAILKAENSLIRLGNREYEGLLEQRIFKPGNTINLRLDNYAVVQRGDIVTSQDIVEKSISMTINPLYSYPVTYTPTDLQRDIVSFIDEVIKPGVRAIASAINNDIYTAALTQIAHFNGDITAPLNTFNSINGLNPQMSVLNMNNYGRNLVVDEYNAYALTGSSDIRNSFLTTLNSQITLDAQLGRLAGFEIFRDTSLTPFISGTHAASGDITVATAVGSGTTIALQGFTSGATVVAGDLLQFAGIYEWDVIGQKPLLSVPKQLVVTTGGTAGVGGTLSISVYPELIASGPRQNFYVPGASPNQIPVNAVVDFITNSTLGYSRNIAFTDKGLALCIPPLEPMDSPYSFVHTDQDTGISMRVSKTAEVLNNKNVLRIDAQMACTWINDQATMKIAQNVSNIPAP